MNKALIVIDMQNDFITGSLGTPEAQAIVPIVKKLIDDGDYQQLYFTRDTHYKNYAMTQEGIRLPIKHCIKHTAGWQIHDHLDTLNATNIFNKETFGYPHWFFTSELQKIDEINIVGLCTDICVITNALILKTLYPEKIINIIENATAGSTPERKQAALDTARSCQINII